MDGPSDPVDISCDRLLVFELALAQRDERAVPGGLALLIDEGFEEFGASGQRWDRTSILELLRASPESNARIERFAVATLGAGVVLTTFEADARTDGEPGMRTLRSSVWVRRRDGWKVRFHQGTPVP